MQVNHENECVVAMGSGFLPVSYKAWLYAQLTTVRTAPINHRKQSFLPLRNDSSTCHPRFPVCQVLFYSLCFVSVYTESGKLGCTTQLQW